MLFGNVLKEDAETVILNPEDQTDEEIGEEINGVITAELMESITCLEGGEEAQKAFIESAEVQALVEARKMSKKTFVRLNKNDDLTRRANLASLILARNAGDPLFKKLALNRVNERKLRNAIFKKYENKAKNIAKKSQQQHIKSMKKMPSLPKINF